MKANPLLQLMIVMCCCGSLFSQAFGAPLAPQKAIILTIEIGEVATTKDKLSATLAATVTSKKTRVVVLLKDTSIMGGSFLIPIDEAGALSKALDAASVALSDGKDLAQKVGSALVSTPTDGEKAVFLKVAKEGFSLSSDMVSFDSDNAAALSRLLDRASRTAEWLQPRLKAIQPDGK